MGGLAELRSRVKIQADSLGVAKATFRNVVTGQIYNQMEKKGTNKSELASRMKISKAAVSRLLSGDRNFTIDTLAHISFVLGLRPEFQFHRTTMAATWAVQWVYERLIETDSVEIRKKRSKISEVRTKSRRYERFAATRVHSEIYA
jgi:transcriptional regulator with XRE-family HTH domain